jgi:hypothetical protein
MQLLLPHHQIDKHRQQFDVVLSGFAVAADMANWLGRLADFGTSRIQTTVEMQTLGLSPWVMPSNNCGFFTTPVIQNAILDLRRSMEFLGLRFDPQGGRICALTSKRRPDDLGIEHFGQALVSPTGFIRVSDSIRQSSEPALAEVHQWSNKKLAHFTVHSAEVRFGPIQFACHAMIAALVEFLYRPLNFTIPDLGPHLPSVTRRNFY